MTNRKYWLALTPPALALFMFMLQGGFGGGHSPCDLGIFLLTLPWSAALAVMGLDLPDFVWLIIIPALLNLAAVAALGKVWPRRDPLDRYKLQ